MNKDFLTSLYLSGVDVSKPKACLGPYFTALSPYERVCILGAGKAAAKKISRFYSRPAPVRCLWLSAGTEVDLALVSQ